MDTIGWKIWLKLHGAGVDVKLPNKGAGAVDGSFTRLMNYTFLFAGIFCTVTIVIAGIFYITAAGNASQLQQSKRAITYALVGLIVIIMATAITNAVLGAL